jgi:decaprenylphospho-beta-D-erythro-pentofuranosid-2-ulose 2-reductase
MTAVVIGASSGLGRALAERMAARGVPVVLVARDERDLRAVAADLALRHDVDTRVIALDLARENVPLESLDAVLRDLPPLRELLLPIGLVDEHDQPGHSADVIGSLANANFVGVARVVDRLLPRLLAAGQGRIAAFSSIAATRGRTRNAAYAAAKRALESYLESVRHACAGTDVRVQTYVVGYLDTGMAFTNPTPLPKASPERLADIVARQHDADFGRRYYPWFWRPLCAVLRWLPWRLYRALRF